MTVNRIRAALAATCLVPAGAALAGGSGFLTGEPAQMTPSLATWSIRPLVTVGEESMGGTDVNQTAFGYRPVGILDGTGAFAAGADLVNILVNNEVGAGQGYYYSLANGTSLRGARVGSYLIDRCSRSVHSVGLAYDTIYDRAGVIVTSAAQINEGFNPGVDNGFDRFCAANGFRSGAYGLVNDCFFMGEEVGEGGSTPTTGMGGQQCVLDVDARTAYVAPMLGRGAWEAMTMVENFGTDKVVALWGDDTEGAPMWLYVGEKGSAPAAGYAPPAFLKDNGFGMGYLYAWVSNAGDPSPQTFNGTGSVRTGRFVRVDHFNPALASTPHWDSLGFASQSLQTTTALGLGACRFSRPEDVATNPVDGTQVVFASTGRGTLFPACNWGKVYIFDFDDADLANQLAGPLGAINNVVCDVRIVYDGDDAGLQFAHPDFGIRSPDNLDWSTNGLVYINEDKSTSPGALFGSVSHVEASLWQLDPVTSVATRVAVIDRSALPFGQSDSAPADLGNWESSGILDVTGLFETVPGETLFICDIQAHSTTSVAGVGLARNASQGNDLVQGGQLVLISNMTGVPCAWDLNCDGDVGFSDLLELLAIWGPCYQCAADVDGDDMIGFNELLQLLADWGPCP